MAENCTKKSTTGAHSARAVVDSFVQSLTIVAAGAVSLNVMPQSADERIMVAAPTFSKGCCQQPAQPADSRSPPPSSITSSRSNVGLVCSTPPVAAPAEGALPPVSSWGRSDIVASIPPAEVGVGEWTEGKSEGWGAALGLSALQAAAKRSFTCI